MTPKKLPPFEKRTPSQQDRTFTILRCREALTSLHLCLKDLQKNTELIETDEYNFDWARIAADLEAVGQDARNLAILARGQAVSPAEPVLPDPPEPPDLGEAEAWEPWMDEPTPAGKRDEDRDASPRFNMNAWSYTEHGAAPGGN